MRIALHGIPGSGKSTLARLLVEEFTQSGHSVSLVRLADPLYQLQALVYRTAGRPLPDTTRQDGDLLAALAGHLRRINPDALTADFRARVAQLPPDSAVVCDDLRAPDVPCLQELGFTLVRVKAQPLLRQARRAARGDLTDGPDEAPQALSAGAEIDNDRSVEDLRAAARNLVRQMAP
jgi:dephospho-CoA kinase